LNPSFTFTIIDDPDSYCLVHLISGTTIEVIEPVSKVYAAIEAMLAAHCRSNRL